MVFCDFLKPTKKHWIKVFFFEKIKVVKTSKLVCIAANRLPMTSWFLWYHSCILTMENLYSAHYSGTIVVAERATQVRSRCQILNCWKYHVDFQCIFKSFFVSVLKKDDFQNATEPALLGSTKKSDLYCFSMAKDFFNRWRICRIPNIIHAFIAPDMRSCICNFISVEKLRLSASNPRMPRRP